MKKFIDKLVKVPMWIWIAAILFIVALFFVVGNVYAAPVVPPAPVVLPIPEGNFWDEWLIVKEFPAIAQQLLVIFSIPTFAVFLGNFAKNFKFMKWMDGKTDKVVAFIATLAFIFVIGAKVFNLEFAEQIMPWLTVKFPEIVNYLLAGLEWVIMIVSIPFIHDKIEGAFLVGKSFNAQPKK